MLGQALLKLRDPRANGAVSILLSILLIRTTGFGKPVNGLPNGDVAPASLVSQIDGRVADYAAAAKLRFQHACEQVVGAAPSKRPPANPVARQIGQGHQFVVKEGVFVTKLLQGLGGSLRPARIRLIGDQYAAHRPAQFGAEELGAPRPTCGLRMLCRLNGTYPAPPVDAENFPGTTAEREHAPLVVLLKCRQEVPVDCSDFPPRPSDIDNPWRGEHCVEIGKVTFSIAALALWAQPVESVLFDQDLPLKHVRNDRIKILIG